MKFQVVVVLLSCVGVASVSVFAPADKCVCPGDKPDATSTLAFLKTALSEKAGLVAKWGQVCQKESAETDTWLKTIGENSETNKKDFEAREKDKRGLAQALEDRIGGLKSFIKELEGILTTLADHIARTNQLYGTKYDANLQDQTAASLTLHGLSLSFEAPHNVRLNPLKEVADFGGSGSSAAEAGPTAAAEVAPVESAATGAATGAAGSSAEAKMMFIEMQVSTQARQCKFEGCMDAYKKTFALYKVGFENNRINKINFEKERSTLGMFRKKTREMLDKKKAKLAKLTQQLTDLNAAMAAPDGKLSELFPFIAEHKKVFDASCADFGTSSASGKEALTELLTAITAKKAETDKEDATDAVEKPMGELNAASDAANAAATDASAITGADAAAAISASTSESASGSAAGAAASASASASASVSASASALVSGSAASAGATAPVPAASEKAATPTAADEDLTKILSTPVASKKL